MLVQELIEELERHDPAAEVFATDQWGATESPVTGVQVRSGVIPTVLLDIEVDAES